MKRIICLAFCLACFLSSSLFGQTDPNVIDFEDNDGSQPATLGNYSSTDLGMVDNNYFDTNYGVSFHLNSTVGAAPFLAKVGDPMTAFQGPSFSGYTGCSNFELTQGYEDLPAAGEDVGCFFLTDDTTVGALTPDLYAVYNTSGNFPNYPTQASGYLLDIDGNEQWTITAYSPIGTMILAAGNPVVLDAQTGGSNVGDGIASYWEFDLGTDIGWIQFEFTGNGNSVGLAFDNFSARSLQNEGCSNEECLTNALDISTGYDHANGAAFPATTGTQDPYWVLTDAPTNNGTVNLNGPAFVIPNSTSWAAPQTNSQYISAFVSSGSNEANINANLAPYSFERCFCVCDEGTVLNFDINVHVDNQVQFYLEQPSGPDIYLDGLTTTTTSNFLGPPEVMNIAPITATVGGQYCLRAELRNDNSGSPMGLNISGTITSEEGVMLTEVCCATDGFITGYKYEDVDCDGELGSNDLPLENWTIELLSPSGQVLETSTTDINGYYTFNVAPGNYIVQEVLQSDWVANNPINGIHPPVAVNSNEVITLNFLNCQYDCDELSVSYSSAVEANGDCCWELSYDNQLGNVYGVRVTALGGVELEYDMGSIGPGLWDITNPGESVTLVPSAGGPLPTGQFNSFFQFCLENIQNVPQQVQVEWLNQNYQVVCDTLFEFECEPVPECLYTSSDTIYCDGPDVIYEFTLTNPPSNPITIGLAKLDVVSPAPVAGVYSQGPISIPPGTSWTGQIVITDGYQLAGQDLCYNIYAHEGPEELYCCFDSTLYCIPIPECPPCEDVWADITPLNMENDSTDCCYRLEVTNNFDDMYFTNIQTVITTPGVTFSDIDFQLPHQWSYVNQVYHKDLMWSHSGGGFIPEVASDFLMDFCLEGITTTDPVEIIVNWFAQDSVVCADTLYVECNDCMWIENEEVVCGPNGDIEYYFSFYNHSGFTVNAVKFVELGFPNDTIAEDLVFLGQDYPSHDGQLITVGPIHIDPGAGPSPPDFCFNISLRYERPEDSLSIECCHLLHCIELPDCPGGPQQECNALHFDGEDDYVEVNSPFSGDTDFTVEMWFNSESTLVGTCQNSNISDFRWLISWDDEDFGIGDCNGDLRVVFAPLCPIGQNLCTSLPAFPINDNNWHHVAYTKTGTETRIFVDGVFFVNFAGAPYNMSGIFRIGAPGSGNQGRPWEGLIDEIRIWDYARSDDQIAEAFNCGLTGNEQGLVTYFPANEGIPGGDNTALTVLTDQSGNGNDGTLNNFTQNGNSSNWLLGYGEVCSPCEDDVPPPFIDLSVNVITINEIVLDWAVSDAGWFDFWLQRRLPGGDWTDLGSVLAETGVSSYSFTDPNPNNDGTIEYQVIGTIPGGEDIFSNIVMIDLPEPPDVVLYPVPAIQDLIIKVPVEGVYELQILNSNGVQIKKYKNPITAEGPVDLDISMLKPGVYFLRLQHETGTTYLKKFVVMY